MKPQRLSPASRPVFRPFALAAACLAWVLGVAVLAGEPAALRAFKAEEPPLRGLDANLYMQTSAEYRACCLQAYNLATFRLRQKVAAFRATNATGPLAVVMDLDETVLDNAGYQAMQVRSGLVFDGRLWDLWETQGTNKVGLIPGAGSFIGVATIIGVATNLGVHVVYLSNRSDSNRDATKRALASVGLGVPDESHLLLLTTTGDKTERRARAESWFTVLLYVGDNLRDFKESYKAPPVDDRTPAGLRRVIDARKAAVDADASLWGDSFIVLPNPAYGEWTKPLVNGKADVDLLAPER